MKTLKYGSEELWEIFDPKFKWIVKMQFSDRFGLSSDEPKRISNFWTGNSEHRKIVDLSFLNITDLPDDWRESKRQRPEGV
jgi:hypothetical protein